MIYQECKYFWRRDNAEQTDEEWWFNSLLTLPEFYT